MKKRNVFFAVLLAMSVLITACGANKQNLDGKWTGSMDLTKQFEDGIIAAYPDLEDYVDFKDLVLKMDIVFDEEQMSMEVKKESIEAFNVSFAEGMKTIAEDYWTAGLAEIDMTLEEAISESGINEDEYLARIYKETGIDKMITSMTEITNQTLDKISKMKGTYTTPLENELRLYYTDTEYESMEYSFKGKVLNIVIQGENFSLHIACEKNK
ncbi:MAG: hypothetical protein IKJ16_05850 [Agathobacter sp.]|nr:hypothetical protein [Agathobacter sp.]